MLLLAADDAGTVERTARLALAGAEVVAAPLAALPSRLAAAASPRWRATMLYVAGNDAGGKLQLLSLDLKKAGAGWITLPAWTAAGGQPTSMAAQNSTVLVTVATPDGKGERLLRWKAKDGWKELAPLAGKVGGGGCSSHRPGPRAVPAASELAGGAPQLWSYHTITGAWARQGELGASGATAATGTLSAATGWGNGLLWASPAAGGQPGFAFTELVTDKRLLKTLDWIVIVVYLAGMLGMGCIFTCAKNAIRPPISSSAAAPFRSGRQASACTPPIRVRSATSRFPPKPSRPTGST